MKLYLNSEMQTASITSISFSSIVAIASQVAIDAPNSPSKRRQRLRDSEETKDEMSIG